MVETSQASYIKAVTVEDAIQAALEHRDGARYIAGGTDVIVNRSQGNDASTCLIDISGISELKRIDVSDEELTIGALVTLEELTRSEPVRSLFPALAQAARAVATPVIRKTATLGGNLMCENRCTYYNQSEFWRNAVGYCLKCDGDVCIATGGKKNCFSKFVSDTAPVLISLDATVRVTDITGIKTIRLEELYTGDGVNPRNISQVAIIQSITIPRRESTRTVFRKLRMRESIEFSSVTTAVTLHNRNEVKIVLGAVDPRPVIISGEVKDRDVLIAQAMKKARIVNNDVFSRNYRKEMIGVYLQRSFDELLA